MATPALSLHSKSIYLQESLFWTLPLEVVLFLLRPYAFCHTVIANDINPVATVILQATLNYPAQFGPELAREIQEWGNRLLTITQKPLMEFYPDRQALPREEQLILQTSVASCSELFLEFNQEQILDYIYTRQVTCPHCGGEAPLLNTCWLSKEAGDQWGVRINHGWEATWWYGEV